MKYAKFIVALITAGVTAAGASGIVLPAWVAQVMPFIGAIGVYLVPNKEQ